MVDEFIPSDFSGVVSLLHDGIPLYKRAFGFANMPNKTLNELDTKFATASAGKAFVSAGIMKLIENGKLSLQT